MEENQDSTHRLSRDEMKRLMARRDGPGLVLFLLQLSVFVALSVVTLRLASSGSSLAYATVTAAGIVLLTFFASMHEAGHGTAFATPWLSRAVLWISAPLMLQAPTFFREFHFEHHRRTSDPDGDPEISGAPTYLAPWPHNPLFYAMQASGQHLMFGKAMFTLGAAMVPKRYFPRVFPYIRPAFQRTVANESRAVALATVAFLWLGWHYVEGFPTLLLAWPVGHLALGIFVMPEHMGLGSEGSQIRRTRSTRSNALVRWSMWNMSWHAEHHAFPAVPFHALPDLSRRIEPELENIASGYLAFHAEALRRSMGPPG
jgi:fatty acid desaturase